MEHVLDNNVAFMCLVSWVWWLSFKLHGIEERISAVERKEREKIGRH